MTTELRLLSRVAYRDQEITGPRLRGLLALLAADLRGGCSAARLVEGLWPGEQPEKPTKALQVLVSRVRTQLGADVIASTPTGYRLALEEDEVDSSAVLLDASTAAKLSRAGDHAGALVHAERGLAHWRGAPEEEPDPDDPVSALRAERAATRRSLTRTRALALSRLGRPGEAEEALAELLRERPHDEEVLLELLRCEAATLGPATALSRYEAYRRALRDELGSDPGPDLQAEHQRLLRAATPAVRHGVPHEPNPLLGRDADLAAVAELMRTSRVTSIVGPGGLGKTRLAAAVGRQAEERVVHLVGLAGVAADADVAGEVASAVQTGPRDARRGSPPDPLASIVEALGPGPALLVLDNCEHVLSGAAELVQQLVSLTRDVRVLTTSRAPLGLSSESIYALPELTLTTAVELFRQRARAARPSAELPREAVLEVCRHLDGLPLAVELAAARMRVMSVAEIAQRLSDRFALLQGGPRDAPQRHRTLESVVDWSWNLLAPAGQAALRALSVFPGGFSADAAVHLLGDADVLPLLEHLAGQSLLEVSDTPVGARFRMLETIREFSAARRVAAGEAGAVLEAFLAWARDFSVANHALLFDTGPFPAVLRVRVEQDNLVRALREATGRGDGAVVAAITATLGGLWIIDSSFDRMATLVDEPVRVLSHYRPAPDFVEVTRAAATICTAYTFMMRGPRATRSLVTLRRLPPVPPDSLVWALAAVLSAAPAILAPDPGALLELCDDPRPWLAAIANAFASYRWETENDPEGALKAAGRIVEFAEQVDSPWLRLLGHARVGELCLQTENGEEARRHMLLAMEVFGAVNEAFGAAWALVLANLQIGDLDAVEHWLARAAHLDRGEPTSALMLNVGARAELRLARGEIDAGLALWRSAVDRLRTAERPAYRVEAPGREQETLETEAITIVVHAQHGRLDLVTDLVEALPDKLATLLANPIERPPVYLIELPICGALTLALAMVDLDRGDQADDADARRSGARLVALAQRMHYLRAFQPTMSSQRARAAAERADRAAYQDAMSEYAALDVGELRAAGSRLLADRVAVV